jgi:hypothetical protein
VDRIYSLQGRETQILSCQKFGGIGTSTHPSFVISNKNLRDSYYQPSAQFHEFSQPHKSRGRERYDPESRKYVEWHIGNDFSGMGVDGLGPGSYPRFTMDERSKMAKRLDRGSQINPRSMGSDWNHDGPKVRLRDHAEFYANAD